MPVSVPEADLAISDNSANGAKSGSPLDLVYLVKNISHSKSPVHESLNSFQWYSDCDLTDLNFESSTPQCKIPGLKRTFGTSRKLNNSSLESTDMEVSDFQVDITNKGLFTPDSPTYYAAKRMSLSRSAKKLTRLESRKFKINRGLFSISSESFADVTEPEVQFSFDDSKQSDIQEDLEDLNAINSESLSDRKASVEFTPKMTSFVKKFQLYDINGKTPRPKRIYKRKMRSKSIPSFKMLDFSDFTPCRKNRLPSGGTDSKHSCEKLRRFDSSFVKSGISQRWSEGKSRKSSEVASDCDYASYLDYADFARAIGSSPDNDSAFDSFQNPRNGNEMIFELETIHEQEHDDHFGAVEAGIKSPKESPKEDCNNVIATSSSCLPNSQSRLSMKIHSTIEWGMEDPTGEISLDPLSVTLVLGLGNQFIHRPMSIQSEDSPAKETTSIAKRTSTVGCKVLENSFIPSAFQAIVRNKILKIMGNGSSKSIANHKFLPNVGKKHNPGYVVQRRRNGPREVHKNVWRLERKTVGTELGNDVKTVDTFKKNACVIL